MKPIMSGRCWESWRDGPAHVWIWQEGRKLSLRMYGIWVKQRESYFTMMWCCTYCTPLCRLLMCNWMSHLVCGRPKFVPTPTRGRLWTTFLTAAASGRLSMTEAAERHRETTQLNSSSVKKISILQACVLHYIISIGVKITRWTSYI